MGDRQIYQQLIGSLVSNGQTDPGGMTEKGARHMGLAGPRRARQNAALGLAHPGAGQKFDCLAAARYRAEL